MGNITEDIKRLPEWIKFLLAIAVSVVMSAVAYGELAGSLRARIEALERGDRLGALEQRIERLESDATHERSEINRVLEGLRTAISQAQLELARLERKRR